MALMRDEPRLGQASTNQHGHFEIRYRKQQFRQSEREQGGAALVVKVLEICSIWLERLKFEQTYREPIRTDKGAQNEQDHISAVS